jgi:hypothetical protein
MARQYLLYGGEKDGDYLDYFEDVSAKTESEIRAELWSSPMMVFIGQLKKEMSFSIQMMMFLQHQN